MHTYISLIEKNKINSFITKSNTINATKSTLQETNIIYEFTFSLEGSFFNNDKNLNNTYIGCIITTLSY